MILKHILDNRQVESVSLYLVYLVKTCYVKLVIFSKGSVIATIKLVFNPEFAGKDNETRLAAAVATGKVGSLEGDKDSFKVVGKNLLLLI